MITHNLKTRKSSCQAHVDDFRSRHIFLTLITNKQILCFVSMHLELLLQDVQNILHKCFPNSFVTFELFSTQPQMTPYLQNYFLQTKLQGSKRKKKLTYSITFKGSEMLYFCGIGVLNVGKLCNNEKKQRNKFMCKSYICI